VQSRRHEHVRELRELPKQLLAEVEHFFVSYNEIKGKKFNPPRSLWLRAGAGFGPQRLQASGVAQEAFVSLVRSAMSPL